MTAPARSRRGYVVNVLGSGSPRRADVVELRKVIDAAALTVTCNGCGEELLRVRQREVNGAPTAFKVRVDQAIGKHSRAKGCESVAEVSRISTTKASIQ